MPIKLSSFHGLRYSGNGDCASETRTDNPARLKWVGRSLIQLQPSRCQMSCLRGGGNERSGRLVEVQRIILRLTHVMSCQYFFRNTERAALALSPAICSSGNLDSQSRSTHCRYPPGSISGFSIHFKACLFWYSLSIAVKLSMQVWIVSLFATVIKKRKWTTSNFPFSSSGTVLKMSSLDRWTFSPYQASGGYCSSEMSSPWSWAVGGSSLATSPNHMLSNQRVRCSMLQQRFGLNSNGRKSLTLYPSLHLPREDPDCLLVSWWLGALDSQAEHGWVDEALPAFLSLLLDNYSYLVRIIPSWSDIVATQCIRIFIRHV